MATFTVGYNDGTPKDHTSIQAAINAAWVAGSPPHEIHVYKSAADSWTYVEDVVIANETNLVGLTLTCLHDGNDGRITIDGGSHVSGDWRALGVASVSVKVWGFDLINGYLSGGDGGGLALTAITADNFHGFRLRIYDNVVEGGYAGGGIGVLPGSDNYLFEATAIYDNVASYAGGVFVSVGGTGGNFKDCSIVDNTATGGGGNLLVNEPTHTGGTVTLTNCILYGGTAPAGSEIASNVVAGKAVTITLNHCDIESIASPAYFYEAQSGTTNFAHNDGLTGEDPLFVGSGDNPYDLQDDSPCIDEGGNTGTSVDVIGRPRPVNGLYDIGAYENQATPPVAAFSGTPLTISVGESVQFTDASTNTPTSWEWKVGDYVASTSQSPEIEFLVPGTFTITLKATNAGGFDEEVKEDYITVQEEDVSGLNFLAHRRRGRSSKMMTLARRYQR